MRIFKKQSFERFLSKIGSFDLLHKHAKRWQEICGVRFDDLIFVPYWKLKHEIPDLLNSGKNEEAIFEIVKCKKKSITLAKIRKYNHYKKLRFILWVQDEYKRIGELENQYLSSPPSSKMIRAGIKDLDVLGDFNLIDGLVEKYGVYTHKEIKEMPYSDIFDIQLRATIQRRIDKKYAKDKGND